MPYIANLENGRGNPTTGALARLAGALGTELRLSFGERGEREEPPSPLPQSLVRLGRTERFRRVVGEIGADPADVVAALAAVGKVVEAGEQDWWRVLDAMVLIARHPA